MSKREQRPGDYLAVCDFSGFTGWASDMVLTVDGFRVLRRFVGSEAERHPQEGTQPLVRNEGAVPWSRPGGTATFRDATAVQPSDL